MNLEYWEIVQGQGEGQIRLHGCALHEYMAKNWFVYDLGDNILVLCRPFVDYPIQSKPCMLLLRRPARWRQDVNVVQPAQDVPPRSKAARRLQRLDVSFAVVSPFHEAASIFHGPNVPAAMSSVGREGFVWSVSRE
jgi:hypothetical protein